MGSQTMPCSVARPPATKSTHALHWMLPWKRGTMATVCGRGDPAVVATLIADVMQPVTVLDDLMATLEATVEP